MIAVVISQCRMLLTLDEPAALSAVQYAVSDTFTELYRVLLDVSSRAWPWKPDWSNAGVRKTDGH